MGNTLEAKQFAFVLDYRIGSVQSPFDEHGKQKIPTHIGQMLQGDPLQHTKSNIAQFVLLT